MSYSYQEALEASLEYFNNDDLAAKVFIDKYALKNREGDILEKTPTDMHYRIAKELAEVEKKKFQKPLTVEKIFTYLDKFKRIIFQGSPMFGIGNYYQYTSLANCFLVESPEDSYGGILKTDEQIVQICKRRGGVGIDISKLRPNHTPTLNAAGSSTGIVPFMERYSNSIREVGQHNRRGASLISLNVHHPEVLSFIQAKKDLKKITGSNISVKLTDEFLKAVEKNIDYQQKWPVDSDNPTISNYVRAKKVWDTIVDNAHQTSEPGLLFWDTVDRETPSNCYEEYTAKGVNPCGELLLSELSACRLLLLNLYTYVREPFTKKAYFDFEWFYNDAQIAQRFQENMIDLEVKSINRIINKIKQDPELLEIKNRELELWEKIKHKTISGRRTGTGITALGDTLAALNVKYGSKKSIEIVDEVYKTLKLACYQSSVDMAKELGPFEGWNYEKEKDNPFLLQIQQESPALYKEMKKYGRRHVSLLTTSPAGSVSILCQTTAGIEPVYELKYKRRKKVSANEEENNVDFVDQNNDKWVEFDIYHPKLKEWMEVTKQKNIEKSPWVCATNINWKDRIKVQAAGQKHNDHSISSTVNLAKDITKEEISKIYLEAWKSGCKGITIYRQGSRDGILIEKDENKDITKRPKSLPCNVHHTTIKGNKYFVLVGIWHDGTPYEVFAGKNGFLSTDIKTGHIIRKRKNFYKAEFNDKDETELSPITATMSDIEESFSRMVSMSLRSGADMYLVVSQLEKIGGDDVHNFAKCIARALKQYIPDNTKMDGEKCPQCNADLVRIGGCPTCSSCSYSKCV